MTIEALSQTTEQEIDVSSYQAELTTLKNEVIQNHSESAAEHQHIEWIVDGQKAPLLLPKNIYNLAQINLKKWLVADKLLNGVLDEKIGSIASYGLPMEKIRQHIISLGFHFLDAFNSPTFDPVKEHSYLISQVTSLVPHLSFTTKRLIKKNLDVQSLMSIVDKIPYHLNYLVTQSIVNEWQLTIKKLIPRKDSNTGKPNTIDYPKNYTWPDKYDISVPKLGGYITNVSYLRPHMNTLKTYLKAPRTLQRTLSQLRTLLS